MRTTKLLFTLFALCLLLLLACLPTFLSTSYGNRALLGAVNRRIGGCLEVKTISLSWVGKQHVEGLSLKDDTGKEVFTFESLTLRKSLFSLLLSRCKLGDFDLIRPFFHYVSQKDGTNNVEKALSLKGRKKKGKKASFCLLKNIHLVDGKAVVEGPLIPSITITDVNIEVKEKPSLFQMEGKTEQGGIFGSFRVSGVLGKEFHLFSEIKNFPVALLDQGRKRALFSTALGSRLDLKGEFEKKSDGIHLLATVDSAHLKGTLKGTTCDGLFVWDPTSSLNLTLSPSFFEELVPAKGWHLANKPQIVVQFAELVVPLSQKNLDFCRIPIQGKLTMERAEVTNEKLGNFSLNDFVLSLHTHDGLLEVQLAGEIQSKAGATRIDGKVAMNGKKEFSFEGKTKGFPLTLLDLFFENGKWLPRLLGSHADLIFAGSYNRKLLDMNYTLTSSLASFTGIIVGEDVRALRVGMKGEYQLPKKTAFYFGEKAHIDLVSTLSLENQHLTMPFLDLRGNNEIFDLEMKGKLGKSGTPFLYQDLHLTLNGTMHKLPFPEGKEGNFFVDIDGKKNLILAKADLGSLIEKGPEVHASAQVEHFITDQKIDLKGARILVSGITSQFPPDLLNLFLDNPLPLNALLGEKLNLQFESTYTPQLPEHLLTLNLEANGEGFMATIAVSLNDALHVQQEKPSFIHWEMTPQRYQTLLNFFSLQGKTSYQLTQTAICELAVQEFSCPTPPRGLLSQFLCQSGFVGTFIVKGLDFRNPSQREHLTIPQIQGSIEGQDFSRAIFMKVLGVVEASSVPRDQKAGFTLRAEMIDLWTPEAKLNRDKMKLKGEIDCDLLPVRELLGFLPLQEDHPRQIGALLGSLVNGRIYGEISELSGPITIDIKSSNFKALLPLELQRGILTLTRAVEAELTLTREVSETFLRDINPLFITGAWSDHPVRLYIDAKGFMIPLRPFDLKNVRIETMVIDLGKIVVRNGGDIQALMNFLKAREVTSEGVMQAWFTPVYVSLTGGIARYKRFDLLLAGNVHLAFWGQIDLIHDRVDMTLGISEKTLVERFNISGAGKSNMFQLKMGGTTSKVNVDWSGASTRIGILIAKSAGGGLGAIVGGFLETFVNTMEQEPTPPPTTHPFPWEKG